MDQSRGTSKTGPSAKAGAQPSSAATQQVTAQMRAPAPVQNSHEDTDFMISSVVNMGSIKMVANSSSTGQVPSSNQAKQMQQAAQGPNGGFQSMIFSNISIEGSEGLLDIGANQPQGQLSKKQKQKLRQKMAAMEQQQKQFFDQQVRLDQATEIAKQTGFQQQNVTNLMNYISADIVDPSMAKDQQAFTDQIVGTFGPPGFQIGDMQPSGMITQSLMNQVVSKSIQQVNYIQTGESSGDGNMVQCSYNIQEGQQINGKTTYYKEAASRTFKNVGVSSTGAPPKQTSATGGAESPEGVLDSSMPGVHDQSGVDSEQRNQDGEQPKKAGRKRRQRRRKHKNKNKDKEGEDEFLDENFDENDEDFQQIYVADETQNDSAANFQHAQVQPQYFDDNQQQVVDDLNYCMEMEMDQNDITDMNNDIMQMQQQNQAVVAGEGQCEHCGGDDEYCEDTQEDYDNEQPTDEMEQEDVSDYSDEDDIDDEEEGITDQEDNDSDDDICDFDEDGQQIFEDDEDEYEDQIDFEQPAQAKPQNHNQQNHNSNQNTGAAAQPQADPHQQPFQNQQQPFQQHKSNQQTQQSQKMKDDVQRQLELFLTDMLVNLYNSKEQSVYENLYIKVISKLHWQSKNVYSHLVPAVANQTGNTYNSMSSKVLQDLFISRIKEIIHTVKRKLVEDSRKEKLIEHCLNPNIQDKKQLEESIQHQQQSANSLGQFISYKYVKDMQTNKSIERPVLTKIKREYKDEPAKFDDILSAIGDYFDLFKTNTNKLECLWLQLLNYFGLNTPQNNTIFREQHYKNYKKIVINNRTLKLLVDEASRWRDTEYASENLGTYLDKIKMIVDESRQLPETYERFIVNNPVKNDLNQKAWNKIKQDAAKHNALLKNKLARQQHQMQKQMQQQQRMNLGQQSEPLYNGFPNPHNVVGHRCDINCYNSMTMANQFPHLAQQVQMNQQPLPNQNVNKRAKGKIVSQDQQIQNTQSMIMQMNQQQVQPAGVEQPFNAADENFGQAADGVSPQNQVASDQFAFANKNLQDKISSQQTAQQHLQESLVSSNPDPHSSGAVSSKNRMKKGKKAQTAPDQPAQAQNQSAPPSSMKSTGKEDPNDWRVQKANLIKNLQSLQDSINDGTISMDDNYNITTSGNVNMTTSHFSYQSYEQQPQSNSKQQDDNQSDKLYRQNLDDIIKYIESDEKNINNKSKVAGKKQKKKQVAAEVVQQQLAQAIETPVDNDEDEQDENAEVSDGKPGETKKKKRRRKNKKKRENQGKATQAEESDQDNHNTLPKRQEFQTPEQPQRSSNKITNLELIVDEEATQASNANQCLSKLSDSEFDQSINEFMNRLKKIEKERSQIKLMPNLEEEWVNRIKRDLQKKYRAATVPGDQHAQARDTQKSSTTRK